MLTKLRRAQTYLRDGKRWVVGLNLEKFLDRANHDVLMARLARQVGDAQVIKLIRQFLTAGMMQVGLVTPRTEGTPKEGRSRRCCPASADGPGPGAGKARTRLLPLR